MVGRIKFVIAYAAASALRAVHGAHRNQQQPSRTQSQSRQQPRRLKQLVVVQRLRVVEFVERQRIIKLGQ